MKKVIILNVIFFFSWNGNQSSLFCETLYFVGYKTRNWVMRFVTIFPSHLAMAFWSHNLIILVPKILLYILEIVINLKYWDELEHETNFFSLLL